VEAQKPTAELTDARKASEIHLAGMQKPRTDDLTDARKASEKRLADAAKASEKRLADDAKASENRLADARKASEKRLADEAKASEIRWKAFIAVNNWKIVGLGLTVGAAILGSIDGLGFDVVPPRKAAHAKDSKGGGEGGVPRPAVS
jgi:hypothetical protein